jgi:hypothetical protein
MGLNPVKVGCDLGSPLWCAWQFNAPYGWQTAQGYDGCNGVSSMEVCECAGLFRQRIGYGVRISLLVTTEAVSHPRGSCKRQSVKRLPG